MLVASRSDYNIEMNEGINRTTHLLLLLMTIGLQSYCQQKLSPKLKDADTLHTKQQIVLSVCYKDAVLFNKTYSDKVSIVRQFVNANVVWVKGKHDSMLQEFISDPNIVFIDRPGTATAEAGTDHANLAFNRITTVHRFFPTLRGQTEKISIKEASFDRNDIDLVNRSFETSLTPEEKSQHATIIATFIAGAGNSSAKGKGVVPEATITSSDFANLLPDPSVIFNDYGIHLQNHSYGVGIENYYGNEAVAYDDQVFQNPTLLHIFSAGNLGQSIPDAGAYKDLPYANLSGTFKQAKNILLVTAVDTSFQTTALNSRGPAYDGRLKPELTAFGQDGTSDAAALVTGVSALVQQEYQEVHDALPPSSMVKAILIASADDLGAPGVDFTYGYGSVNADRAIQLVAKEFTETITLEDNEESTVVIDVPENTASVTIATVWTDPPASPNAGHALVNDVDSYVTDGITNYLPWVLNAAPNSDSLTAQPTRKKDHDNNVEYITKENPTAGSYQLHVKAPSLQGSQIVSVAYWIEDNTSFRWDYPSASDILEGGRKQTLFWNEHTASLGTLSYQLNNGPWQLLRNDVDLNKYSSWTPPDTLASARLKMELSGEEFISDEFVISPIIKTHVAYNCDNAFLLTWSAVKGADGYNIYTLRDKYLDAIMTVPDTNVVLDKNSTDVYYAVAPIVNGKTGLNSETINYTLQGSFCYINLFVAERYDEDQVAVRLTLSTTLAVDHVTIFKDTGMREEVLAEVDPGNITSFEWLDDKLDPGSIKYQAELFFTDGSTLRSDISEVLIEAKGRAIVFPNPVTGNAINVLSEGSGLVIRIVDTKGEIIYEEELESREESLNVGFAPGFYIYQLIRNGKVIDTGKFVTY